MWLCRLTFRSGSRLHTVSCPSGSVEVVPHRRKNPRRCPRHCFSGLRTSPSFRTVDRRRSHQAPTFCEGCAGREKLWVVRSRISRMVSRPVAVAGTMGVITTGIVWYIHYSQVSLGPSLQSHAKHTVHPRSAGTHACPCHSTPFSEHPSAGCTVERSLCFLPRACRWLSAKLLVIVASAPHATTTTSLLSMNTSPSRQTAERARMRMGVVHDLERMRAKQQENGLAPGQKAPPTK